jgi:hypothetical protein
MKTKKTIGEWEINTDEDVTVTLPKIDQDEPQSFMIKKGQGEGVITIQAHPDDQKYSVQSLHKRITELQKVLETFFIGGVFLFLIILVLLLAIFKQVS